MADNKPNQSPSTTKHLVVLQILGSPGGWGGAEGIALLLAEAMRKRGHEMLFASARSNVLERFQRAGFEVLEAQVRSVFPIKSIFLLADFMRRRHVNVVHCHSRRAGITGLPAAHLAHIPAKILHVHSLATATGSKLLSRLTFKILSLLADRTVCCSVAARDAIKSKHNKRMIVIPNGIDLNVPHRTLSNDTPTIVSVGRLAQAKGYHILLEAAKRVASEFPAVQFEIAGEGELLEELTALRTRLGLTENVKFLGFVEDMHSLFVRATAFVMPSIWEGLPLALLEAIAAGVPVVATSVGEVPRVLGNGKYGWLVPVRSPHALAKAIVELLQNPQEAERRVEQARHWIQQCYSVETMVDAIERLYWELLKQT